MNMTCNWCEEEKEIINFCNIDDHKVCEECYSKYQNTYPLRIEGCPYCVGTQEKLIIYIVPTNEPALIPCDVLICLIICSIICLGIIITIWFHMLKIIF